MFTVSTDGQERVVKQWQCRIGPTLTWQSTQVKPTKPCTQMLWHRGLVHPVHLRFSYAIVPTPRTSSAIRFTDAKVGGLLNLFMTLRLLIKVAATSKPSRQRHLQRCVDRGDQDGGNVIVNEASYRPTPSPQRMLQPTRLPSHLVRGRSPTDAQLLHHKQEGQRLQMQLLLLAVGTTTRCKARVWLPIFVTVFGLTSEKTPQRLTLFMLTTPTEATQCGHKFYSNIRGQEGIELCWSCGNRNARAKNASR